MRHRLILLTITNKAHDARGSCAKTKQVCHGGKRDELFTTQSYGKTGGKQTEFCTHPLQRYNLKPVS